MIFYRSPAEIEALDQANALVLKVLDALERMVAPGVTTWVPPQPARVTANMIPHAAGFARRV